MAHPLDSSDDRHDFSLNAGELVGASGEVRFCDTAGCADTRVPGPFRIAIASLPNGKANQTITFWANVGKTYGDADFNVAATASSRLAVSFAASGACTVSGTTVHLTGAGSCTITASQAGNAKWHPAPDVVQTFSAAKASQMIVFAALANTTYGAADFTVRASASSRLPVSFAAGGTCTVSGTTVHLTGAGSCTITASQAGNANYLAATAVSRTFAIKRAPCRVPKVTGKRLLVAKRAIARNHCRTGKVRNAYSPTKRGLVISQSRPAGRVLPPSSKIDLLVSRGRRR
jgi:PASTA domain